LLEANRYRVSKRRDTRVCIQQLQMCRRVEERLLIALAVNIHQKRLQLFEQRLGSNLVIDKDLVSAASRQLASDYDFCLVRILDLDARIPENLHKFGIRTG